MHHGSYGSKYGEEIRGTVESSFEANLIKQPAPHTAPKQLLHCLIEQPQVVGERDEIMVKPDCESLLDGDRFVAVKARYAVL